MRLLCLESDLEMNTKIIEDFLTFPTTIYTYSYDQWFKSYQFWKLNHAAVTMFWAEYTNLEFESTSNGKLEEP
jgi:hypothetical protein